MSLYDDLGVSKDASQEEIKKAYRRRAQKAHPDKPGGDGAAFHKLTVAFEILGDPGRRRRYDDSGEQDVTDERAQLLGTLANLLMAAIDDIDVERTNIFDGIRAFIADRQRNMESRIRSGTKSIAKREKVLKRIIKRKPGTNIFAAMLRADIRATQIEIERTQDSIKKGQQMLEILADYEYQVDTDKPADPGMTRLLQNATVRWHGGGAG